MLASQDVKIRDHYGVTIEPEATVTLATDPRKAEGTVVHIEGDKLFVAWNVGRTWIYEGHQLVVLSRAHS